MVILNKQISLTKGCIEPSIIHWDGNFKFYNLCLICCAEYDYKYTLEKTEGTINNGQSRDTGKIRQKTQNEYTQNKKGNTDN